MPPADNYDCLTCKTCVLEIFKTPNLRATSACGSETRVMLMQAGRTEDGHATDDDLRDQRADWNVDFPFDLDRDTNRNLNHLLCWHAVVHDASDFAHFIAGNPFRESFDSHGGFLNLSADANHAVSDTSDPAAGCIVAGDFPWLQSADALNRNVLLRDPLRGAISEFDGNLHGAKRGAGNLFLNQAGFPHPTSQGATDRVAGIARVTHGDHADHDLFPVTTIDADRAGGLHRFPAADHPLPHMPLLMGNHDCIGAFHIFPYGIHHDPNGLMLFVNGLAVMIGNLNFFPHRAACNHGDFTFPLHGIHHHMIDLADDLARYMSIGGDHLLPHLLRVLRHQNSACFIVRLGDEHLTFHILELHRRTDRPAGEATRGVEAIVTTHSAIPESAGTSRTSIGFADHSRQEENDTPTNTRSNRHHGFSRISGVSGLFATTASGGISATFRIAMIFIKSSANDTKHPK